MNIDILLNNSTKIDNIDKLINKPSKINKNIIWGEGYNIRLNNKIVEVCVFDQKIEKKQIIDIITPLLSKDICCLYKIYENTNNCYMYIN